MDVSQRQIGKTAGGDLLFADGIVPGLRGVDLPVEQADMELPVGGGGEASEEAVGLLTVGKGRTVEHQIFFRPFHCFQPGLSENMHIFRPLYRQVGTAGAVPVMVAGGDVDLRLHLPQSGGEFLCRVPVGGGAVKEVPRQQHQINVILVDVVSQPHR